MLSSGTRYTYVVLVCLFISFFFLFHFVNLHSWRSSGPRFGAGELSFGAALCSVWPASDALEKKEINIIG